MGGGDDHAAIPQMPGHHLRKAGESAAERAREKVAKNSPFKKKKKGRKKI